MTKEENSLLLKDLCARLPYDVICYWRIGSELTLNLTEYNGQLTCINKVEIEDSSDYYYDCYFNVCNDSNGNSFQNEDVPIEIVKPYLRPLSSMNEEEAKELSILYGLKDILSVKVTSDYIDVIVDDGVCSTETRTIWYDEIISSIKIFDWLNANYFDYRGLIEKGLALEAPEGMYNIKEK